jgi:hypothetical protein
MRRNALRLALLALAVFVVLPAPAALADDITLGTTVAGAEREKLEKNSVYGNVYALAEGGTTESFSAYVRGGRDNQVFQPVIFQVDAGGNPTTLVAVGPEVKVKDDQPAGWVTTTLPATSLPPGSYFVGVFAGPHTNGARIFSDAVGTLLTGVGTYPAVGAEFGPVQVVEGVTLSAYVTLESAPAEEPGDEQPGDPGEGEPGEPGPPAESAAAPKPRAPNRAGYCLDGRFVDLLNHQAELDPAYAGATPAFYVEGRGLTCDPPTGLTYVGLYRGSDAAWDFYPYYR